MLASATVRANQPIKTEKQPSRIRRHGIQLFPSKMCYVLFPPKYTASMSTFSCFPPNMPRPCQLQFSCFPPKCAASFSRQNMPRPCQLSAVSRQICLVRVNFQLFPAKTFRVRRTWLPTANTPKNIFLHNRW